MNELTPFQKRMIEKIKIQEKWKYEAMDITISILLGVTHREKEQHTKTLLAHLKNMPEIYDSELNLPQDDDLPF